MAIEGPSKIRVWLGLNACAFVPISTEPVNAPSDIRNISHLKVLVSGRLNGWNRAARKNGATAIPPNKEYKEPSCSLKLMISRPWNMGGVISDRSGSFTRIQPASEWTK